VLKPCVAVALMIPVYLSPCCGADENAEWKPETEQAALTILRQARERAGELFRFDVEYLRSCVDDQFGTEERSRVRTYCEDPLGYIIEIRAIDDAHMKSARRSKSGEPYKLKKGKLETWASDSGSLTVLDEERRTYTVAKVSSRDGMFGFLADSAIAHQAIPPWLDPTLDWDDLKSRFRIIRAESTPTRFSIEFAIKERAGASMMWIWRDCDPRLESNQVLIIDRKTLLPKWWRIRTSDTSDQTFVFTRFDVDPPRRELQVSVNGYKLWSLPQTTEPAQKPLIDGDSLQMAGRVLLWLLL
jgi:hypothetical protein